MSDAVYYSELLGLINQAAQRYAEENRPSKVFSDGKLVNECAERAAVTLREYNMSGEPVAGTVREEAPNYFKEAGHFAYWIVRLKPLRLVNYGLVHKALVMIGTTIPEELEAALPKTQNGIVVLNEYAAVYVASQVIFCAERDLFELRLSELPENTRETEQQRFNALQEEATRRLDRMLDYVRKSLRYDTHSPNSLALLFESLCGSGYPLD